jgi:hypothetical protein
MLASQIIKQSLDLANLSNTSFVSHAELEQYINDAFVSIYSTMAQRGNDYWLETAYAPAFSASYNGYTEYYLPSDFYIAKQVYSDNHPLTRKSNTENGYSIVNGMLRIYGSYGNIKLDYYPKPTFISFPTSMQAIKDLEVLPDLAFGNHVYLSAFDTIMDIETGKTITIDIGGQPLMTSAIKMGKGFLVVRNDTEEKYKLIDFTGNVITEMNYTDGYYLLDGHGNPYSYYLEDRKIYPAFLDSAPAIFSDIPSEIMSPNNILILEDDFKGIFSMSDVSIWTEDYTYLLSDYDAFIKDTSLNASPVYPNVYQVRFDGKIGIVYPGNTSVLFTINEDAGILDYVAYKTKATIRANVLVEKDENFYFFDSNVLSVYMVGWEPDTVMDYPNNIFYRALASYIAVQLLAKQSADTTNMQSSFTSLVGTLTQTLDASSDYPTIKNAYY